MEKDGKTGKDSKDSKELALQFKGFEEKWEERTLNEMFPQKGSRVPEIRFQSFTGNWEERKFSEMVTLRRGLTYRPSDIREHGVRVLRSSNIHEDTFVLHEDDVFVRQEAVSLDFAKEGDILITAANGSARLIGKHAVITQCLPQTMVPGGFMLLATNHSPYFFNASLGSSWYKRFIQVYTAGGNGAIGNLNKNILDKQDIFIPSDEEQQRIGDYFHALDRLISLQQQKLHKLQDFKKAMLDKMFPQKGSRVPEIRFQGFTGNWEERKFSEMVTLRRGLTYRPSDIREHGVRVLRSSNIHEDTFVLHEDDVFVRQEAVNLDFAKEGDILITAANGSARLIGKHAVITQCLPQTMVPGGFMLLATSHSPYFFNASLGSSWYKRFIQVYTAGGNGAIGNLNKNILDKQDIFIPSDEEQQRIGDYFHALDRLISLHRQKLEKLQSLKKAMLEQMFPAPPRQA